MTGERDLVERFFTFSSGSQDVEIGIGDDAAVVGGPAQLCLTTDTLVAGTHFAPDTSAYYLGRKALAVNLSDLAAMGAFPRYALLSLTLPAADHDWLQQFADGFQSMAGEHGVALIGGDLARGAVASITVTAAGDASAGTLPQTGASPGDELWLSGSVGAAGAQLRGNAAAEAGSALHDPTPRVKLGTALVGTASAAIDLSDGLCAAVLQLADCSSGALSIDGALLPVSDMVAAATPEERIIQAVCSGEDYELLFAAPAARRERVLEIGKETGVPLTCIGAVAEGSGAGMMLGEKTLDLQTLATRTYQHFSVQEGDCEPSLEELADQVRRIGGQLVERGWRLAVAESCTGGLLAATVTEVAGSSDWFEGGVVAYTPAMKTALLGVAPELIAAKGVVSESVAAAMASGSLARFAAATHAIGITGWAGPAGGDGQTPGTVCIGWSGPEGGFSSAFHFSGDRGAVRRKAVQAALAQLESRFIR